MAVVAPGGVDPAGVATAKAPAASPATAGAGRRWDRAVILFLGPTALIMLIFLVYPTLYTIALSFNRGRRGEFTEWVGLQHYIGLFQDKAFINLGTFPPS